MKIEDLRCYDLLQGDMGGSGDRDYYLVVKTADEIKVLSIELGDKWKQVPIHEEVNLKSVFADITVVSSEGSGELHPDLRVIGNLQDFFYKWDEKQ